MCACVRHNAISGCHAMANETPEVGDGKFVTANMYHVVLFSRLCTFIGTCVARPTLRSCTELSQRVRDAMAAKPPPGFENFFRKKDKKKGAEAKDDGGKEKDAVRHDARLLRVQHRC